MTNDVYPGLFTIIRFVSGKSPLNNSGAGDWNDLLCFACRFLIFDVLLTSMQISNF